MLSGDKISDCACVKFIGYPNRYLQFQWFACPFTFLTTNMDSTSDTTGETQLVSQWTRPTDGVTKNISHLDDDNTMSLENRESLGPAVGAEDCDEGCRLNRENSEEILEEVYESSVTPGDENAESQAPWESSEPRDTRESLFQLLGDVDSLTRIHCKTE